MYNALTLEQCEKLPTHRLLAYYKKHKQSPIWLECDYTDKGRETEVVLTDYFGSIKAILDKREHIEK